MDMYFYSVEPGNDGNSLIHMLGNVYFNDADMSYKHAEYTFLYMTPAELKNTIDNECLFEKLDENVAYMRDITERKAYDICATYFYGESGSYLPISQVNQDTPCGNYWFSKEGDAIMTKKAIKKMLSDLNLFEDDIECMFCFVSDLLDMKANHLKVTEPYATTTIRKLEEAAYEVWNLLHDIEEVMESDENED